METNTARTQTLMDKVKKTTERITKDGYVKFYEFTESVQIASFIDIVKHFENDDIKMSECNCFSFDSDGSPSYDIFYDPESILEMKDAPNPYVKFVAKFCDRNTKDYRFVLSTSTNSTAMTYRIDNDKLNK